MLSRLEQEDDDIMSVEEALVGQDDSPIEGSYAYR